MALKRLGISLKRLIIVEQDKVAQHVLRHHHDLCYNFDPDALSGMTDDDSMEFVTIPTFEELQAELDGNNDGIEFTWLNKMKSECTPNGSMDWLICEWFGLFIVNLLALSSPVQTAHTRTHSPTSRNCLGVSNTSSSLFCLASTKPTTNRYRYRSRRPALSGLQRCQQSPSGRAWRERSVPACYGPSHKETTSTTAETSHLLYSRERPSSRRRPESSRGCIRCSRVVTRFEGPVSVS